MGATIFSLVLVGSTAFLSADPAPSGSASEQSSVTPFDDSVTYDFTPTDLFPSDPNEAVPPPREPGRWKPTVSVEYLFLQPRRAPVDYAIVDSNVDAAVRGDVATLGYDANGGVRLGIGTELPSAGQWDIMAWYAYLHSSDSQSSTAPAGGTVFASLMRPGVVSEALVASGSASLDLDVFDFEIGRRVQASDSVDLRVVVGPRVAIIDQKLNVLYDGTDASNATYSSPIDFTGVGLRLGGESRWRLSRGFGLYARAFGSMLAGEFRARLSEFNDDGATPITEVFRNHRSIVPVFEFAVGMGWQGEHVHLRAGYEVAAWLNMLGTPEFTDDVNAGRLIENAGTLTIDGLALRLGVDF